MLVDKNNVIQLTLASGFSALDSVLAGAIGRDV